MANKRQSWSRIFYSLANNGLALPAVLPIYHPDGTLKLVANAEYSLQVLDDFMNQPSVHITEGTIAFVCELDGVLVASKPAGLSTALEQGEHTASGATRVRMNVVDAVSKEHPEEAQKIRRVGRWLLDHFGSFAEVPEREVRGLCRVLLPLPPGG